MPAQAHFSCRVDGDLLIIEDQFGPVSVTADAEQVLNEVQTALGSLVGKHILWHDQEGIWDALCWSGQLMIYPLGCATLEEAIAAIRTQFSIA